MDSRPAAEGIGGTSSSDRKGWEATARGQDKVSLRDTQHTVLPFQKHERFFRCSSWQQEEALHIYKTYGRIGGVHSIRIRTGGSERLGLSKHKAIWGNISYYIKQILKNY